ncbi:nuclear transport factor 2 family protein [Bradyrhizobium sp. Leo121]|uniref:nuclear transport factor 2 family protein n=1 Tax=Bradyrhizobium sp. Leo121 TaxID=1571195 RepID=UPI00102A8B83|nr:nuclear transport factor 2 family protein [Bradyrhizobium sp. Leo121]RZN35502.1 polyketide cyclase [Bradyrhizobium sp. Leo121]
MSLDLPGPVAVYFAADSRDGDAIAQCFSERGVVKDEGRKHEGRAAIAQWKADASTKYNYTSEPFAVEERDGKIVVTAHVVGDFPGSPIDLRYFFGLDGDKIASLEILP